MPGGGTLSCRGLEALWESAGGSSAAAFTAAEIAMAESGGRQYATNLNDGNGTTDRGYWQINSVHGSLSTYDAYANARAAVLISNNGTRLDAVGDLEHGRLPRQVLGGTRMNLSSMIPLAVIAFVVYLLQRSGMQLWHALVCLVLGVALAGTILGPDISSILSQLSGGHLH